MKHPKMDRYLISNQKWEILHVRLIHYKMEKESIVHPTSEYIKELVKQCNNSRRRVYEYLKAAGFINITAK